MSRTPNAYERHMQAPLLPEPLVEPNRHYRGTVVYPDGHKVRADIIRWEGSHLQPADRGLHVNTSEWDADWHRWDRRCSFIPDAENRPPPPLAHDNE
jgi:hypothetical protein